MKNIKEILEIDWDKENIDAHYLFRWLTIGSVAGDCQLRQYLLSLGPWFASDPVWHGVLDKARDVSDEKY